VFVLEMLKPMLAPTRICGIHCLNKIKQRYELQNSVHYGYSPIQNGSQSSGTCYLST
jgi:hypothetical protein